MKNEKQHPYTAAAEIIPDVIPGHCTLDILSRLSEETGVRLDNIPMNDPKVMDLLISGDTDHLPEFGTPFAKNLIRTYKPTSLSDLLKISGLCHGTKVWDDNAENLIKAGKVTLQEVPVSREDVYDYLVNSGMDHDKAYRITEIVRKGRADRDLSEMNFEGYELPEWFYGFISKIEYMAPKAHVVRYVEMDVQMAWFKLYHTECFNNFMAEGGGI